MIQFKNDYYYNSKKSLYFEQQLEISSFYSSESWIVLTEIEQRIKSKIESKGTPLKDWDINIYRGILTGYNEAFIIDGKKKEELIAEDPKSVEIIRPILRGRDIKSYSHEFANLYIITTFPSLKIDIEEYLAIKQHLMSFGYDRLKQSGDVGSRKKTNNKWFETQDSINYWEDFYQPKIVWKRVGSILRFSYDTTDILALDSTCFATGGRYIKYLVAVLNSNFGKYLLRDAPKTGTGDLLISVQAIEPLKIPIPSEENLVRIDSLVDHLICKHDIKYENQITSIIYNIFQFNDEEIDFIEFQ